jgi:hypothetical protein
VEISADAFDSFTRLASALSLLALYKIGRGSGWHRARCSDEVPRTDSRASSRGSPPEPGPPSESRRNGLRLHSIVAGAWIALSLLLLGYATIEGEFAVADLDGLELVRTYVGSVEAP